MGHPERREHALDRFADLVVGGGRPGRDPDQPHRGPKPTFLHNLVLELTRLSLEVQELRSRNLELASRIEALARREKTLEGMVAYRREGGSTERGE